MFVKLVFKLTLAHMSGSIYQILQTSAGICPAPETSVDKDTISAGTRLYFLTSALRRKIFNWSAGCPGEVYKAGTNLEGLWRPLQNYLHFIHSHPKLKGFLKSLELTESISTHLWSTQMNEFKFTSSSFSFPEPSHVPRCHP